jgi:hypothetical protein
MRQWGASEENESKGRENDTGLAARWRRVARHIHTATMVGSFKRMYASKFFNPEI